MRRVRMLAGRTPVKRERYVDFLRALAISLVVLGHWTVTVVTHDASGHLTGFSALTELVGPAPYLAVPGDPGVLPGRRVRQCRLTHQQPGPGADSHAVAAQPQ